MLKQLQVLNFAIIEDLTVNFKSNMTVLTGQTGAGKSLIIDSINLLLGSRADSDVIRYGSDYAKVIGIFDNLSTKIIEHMKTFDIRFDNEIEVVREINISGKNKITINGKNITLNQLKIIGLALGDIHVQHDTYRLINKDTYLSFLDNFNDRKFLKIYNDYQFARSDYLQKLKVYKESISKKKAIEEKIDLLIFQNNEITDLGLVENEDTDIENEILELKNFDIIYKNLNEAYLLIDSETNTLDNIFKIGEYLSELSQFKNSYQENSEIVMDAFYQLEEVKNFLSITKDGLDFDPKYLENLNKRSYELNKIKDKYKMSINELIEYNKKIELEIALQTNFDQTVTNMLNDVEKAFKEAKIQGNKLTEYRRKKAYELEKRLVTECRELDLEDISFKVSFLNVEVTDYLKDDFFLTNGIDVIDFLITLNKGEPLKPLAKVASGGELSRIMLAIKAIYVEQQELSFMVFDEIDSGISGQTALKIAKKMHKIGQKIQLLAISHLAQVAATADTQLLISKVVNNGRTNTEIKELNYEQRVTEIAMMLAGIGVNDAMIVAAKSLLNQSFN